MLASENKQGSASESERAILEKKDKLIKQLQFDMEREIKQGQIHLRALNEKVLRTEELED